MFDSIVRLFNFIQLHGPKELSLRDQCQFKASSLTISDQFYSSSDSLQHQSPCLNIREDLAWDTRNSKNHS